MPKIVGGLWRLLEAKLGEEIPKSARDFLASEGAVAEWLEAKDEAGRRHAEIADRMVATVRNLQQCGLIPGSEILDVDIGGDARWQLEEELYGPQPAPIIVSQGPLELYAGTYQPSAQRVLISFDPRISQRVLIRELKHVWRDLERLHWIRPTRTPDDETIALLRFVCFEVDKNTTWRERLAEWNRRYPEWPKDTDSNFAKSFRRAAKRLTGDVHGLEWAHNPLWSLDTSTLREMAVNGDRRARDTLALKLAQRPFSKALADMGMDGEDVRRVIREIGEEGATTNG